MGSDARAAAGARRTDRAKPIAKKSAVKRAKAPAPSKRRGTGHMGLVLAAFVVAAALLYLSGGTQSHTGTPGADAEIAASRAMLTQLAQQAPVDLNAELKRQRKEELKAKNGLLVDDLEAEKLKILAMTDADWSKADITRWFENAAIVGDSIIRQVRLFHFLDAPVFAEGGIHISVELPLLDEVEAAAPSVIFLCFGMNDVGVFEDRVDRYVGRYTNVIRRLQASLPEAVIYVCAALPVTPERLAEEPKYGYLDLYNREMEKACPEAGAYFIDSSFILEAHPEWYNVDGRHPREEYYPMWLTYLADLAGLNHD
ncbi:MAG: SGNH/GDSL hydrolase family protein [Clostridia bacterium]|nr:SGNH/GDSL hydrolase family protein [Clostridia bacterium]